MKKSVLILFFLLKFTSLYSEDYSIKRVHEQAGSLINEARALNERKSQLAKQKLDSCHLLLIQKPNSLLETLYYLEVAKYYKYQCQYSDAIASAMQASILLTPESESNIKAEIEYIIGSSYFLLSDFNQAIKHLQLSSQLFDSLEMFTDYIHAQNALGSCFFSLEKIDLARKYFEQVYQFAQNGQDSLMWFLSLNNLAAVLNDQPERTIQLYHKAIEIGKKLKLEQDLSGLFMNVGLAYWSKANTDSAYTYFKIANKYQKLSHDTSTQVMIWLNMALLLHESQHNDSALYYASKSIELASKTELNFLLVKLYQLKSDIYQAKGDFRLALENLQQSNDLKDLVWNENLAQDVAVIEKSFESERIINEMVLRKEKLENQYNKIKLQRIYNIALLVSLVFLVTLITLIFAYSKRLKRSNQSLRKKNSLIQVKNSKLKETVNSRDKLISIIAHDIKNPLSAILGFSELMAYHSMPDTNPELLKYANEIKKSANNLNDLLNNLLIWAKAQKESIKIHPEPINIYQMLDTNLKLYTQLAHEKNIELINDTIATHYILADKNTTNIIFRNLINNSIKFTGAHGYLKVWSEANGQDMLIHVEDNGHGMSKHEIDHVFFGKPSIKEKSFKQNKGTGLGLQLCQEFTKLNRGKMEVSSVPGEGTRFTIYLPKSAV